MAAYASVSDLMSRFDKRDILDLASDTGVAIEEPEAATNLVLLAVLDDASGDIESSLVHAGRYSVAELEGLDGNSEAKLKRLVCARAMYYLLDRRPAWNPERPEHHHERRTDLLTEPLPILEQVLVDRVRAPGQRGYVEGVLRVG